MMPLNFRVHYLMAVLQCRHGADIVLTHETAVTLVIGTKDARQFAVELRLVHRGTLKRLSVGWWDAQQALSLI